MTTKPWQEPDGERLELALQRLQIMTQTDCRTVVELLQQQGPLSTAELRRLARLAATRFQLVLERLVHARLIKATSGAESYELDQQELARLQQVARQLGAQAG